MPESSDNTAYWPCGEKRSTNNAFSRLSSPSTAALGKSDKKANVVRRLVAKAIKASDTTTNLMPPNSMPGVYFPRIEGREASQADNDKRQKAKLRRI